MKALEALQKIKFGGIKTVSTGTLYRVFLRRYGIKYNEKKGIYVVFEPFVGNQRQVSCFNNSEQVNQYIAKYHGK